jgi:uncharacterized protein (TIGR03067 family)
MRHAVYALCLLAAAQAATASDTETFQGNWKLALAIHDGRPQTGADLDAKLTVQGDQFSVQGPPAWPLSSGSFQLNESASPKQIDLKSDNPALGIYEVRAGNRIRVCIAPPGTARPTRFESKAGSGYYFQEWIRVK